ncbi:MAG: hypothetical protein IJY84_05140 [Clostridia bacterium]|nr:hypothetical protein [Clostridia bacterium]
MDVKLFEALEYLVKNKSVDDFLADTSKLSSALKDLCISTRTIRDEAEVFCQIDHKLKIFKTLKKDPKTGKDELIGKYSKVKSLVAEDVFERFITAVAGLLDPSLKCVAPSLLDAGAPKPKKPGRPKKVAVEQGSTPPKKPVAPKPATPKPVTPKPATPKPKPIVPPPQPKPKYTPPPQPQRQPKPASKEPSFFAKCYNFIFTIIALVLTAIACFIAVISNADWGAWQWIIGIGGGLVFATAIMHILLGIVEDDEGIDKTVAWVDGVVVILNIVAFAILGEGYTGIFYGLSIVMLVASAFFCGLCFYTGDTVGAIFNLVVAIATLIGVLVFVLIAFSIYWNVMQWITAIGALIVLFGVGAPIVYLLDDEGDCDYYTTTGIILAIVTVANIILQSLLIDLYAVIFYFINGASLVVAFIFMVITFDDYEEEWGWFYLLTCLLNVFSVVFVALIKPLAGDAVSPWVLGVGGIAIILPMAILFLRRLEDDYVVEGYSLGTLICAIIQTINVILMAKIGQDYFLTFLIVATAAFIGALVMVVVNVVTEELGYLIFLNIVVIVAIPLTVWLFGFDGLTAISTYFSTVTQA